MRFIIKPPTLTKGFKNRY